MSAGTCVRMRSHAARVDGGVILGTAVSVVVFGTLDIIAVRGAWQIFLDGSFAGLLQTGCLSKHG